MSVLLTKIIAKGSLKIKINDDVHLHGRDHIN